MKRLLSCIIMVVIMCGLVGCSVDVGIRSHSKDMKDISDSVNIDGIDGININNSYGKVEVSTYNGDEIKIKGKYNKSSSKYKIKEKDNKITITCSTGKLINFGFDNSDSDNYIEILIPESYYGNIKIDSEIGNCKINNIIADKLFISNGAGELTVKGAKFNELKLDSGVGSSSIELFEKSGDIVLEGGVGEIEINIAEVGGDLKCDNGVGEVKIRIPNDSPVDFKTNSGIGECKIDAKTSGEGLYTFDLDVGIGEIKVYN